MSNEYINHINEVLKPVEQSGLSVIDLFAGCGGLALGFAAAGFQTLGFEKDSDAAQTYEANLEHSCRNIELTVDTVYPTADIVIGGPPCQPFSVGGHQKGLDDSRDGFPIFIKAIDQIRPKMFMFENVRGLLYQNKWYLEEVILKLEQLGYIIDARVLNAVHFGVPQKRERLIVVGHKGGYTFPKPLHYKVTAGEALGQLAFESPPESRFLTPSMDAYVAKYEKASSCKVPRDLHLDKPSRTLTCRNIAAPTGDMMRIRLPDGRRRRILIREAARLQSFPDWFQFYGSETSQYYQIGNAVPPLLGYGLALSVKSYLEEHQNKATTESHESAPRERALQLDLFAAD